MADHTFPAQPADPGRGNPEPHDTKAPQTKPNTTKILIALIVLAGIAASVFFISNRNKSEKVVGPELPATTPIFEPKDARGLDPFFPIETQLVAYSLEEKTGAIALPKSGTEPGTERSEELEQIQISVSELKTQAKTGLFGGSEEQTCDPERIISFLFANPKIGEAWAKVHGLNFDQIPTFIRSLDARVLAEPLNVINHGYSPEAGGAYEIDSVLGAGTAVLVDADGNVAIRCYCGNPIKPKPTTQHQPPRCLATGAQVFTEAGGSELVLGAPRDVRLTGEHHVTDAGSHFSQVSWGPGDGEKGWVRADLIYNNYCPAPTEEWYCPINTQIQVWASPEGPGGGEPVGTLGGSITNADGTTTSVFSQVTPVGGNDNPVKSNGYILINFTQGSPSTQNSGWVNFAELQTASKAGEECIWQPRCVEVDAIHDRAGGSVIRVASITRLAFTGNFTTTTDLSGNSRQWAEVQMTDGTGAYGWVTDYSIVDNSHCEEPQRGCIAGETPLFPEPEITPYLDGQSALFGTPVTIISGPVNSMMQIQVSHGGPTGWVPAHTLTEDWNKCEPRPQCFKIENHAYSAPDPNSETVAVPNTATVIYLNGAWIVPAPGETGYLQMTYGGQTFWVADSDLISLSDEECQNAGGDEQPGETGDGETLACMTSDHDTPDLGEHSPTADELHRSGAQVYDPETGEGIPGSYDRLAAPKRCCVSELYEQLGDTSSPVAGPHQVTVASVLNLADDLWYSTDDGYHFPASALTSLEGCGDSEGSEVPEFCPAPIVIHADNSVMADPSPEFEPRTKCCYVQPRTGPGHDYPVVGFYDRPLLSPIVDGPVGTNPAWFQDQSGNWFSEYDIINPSVCDYWLGGGTLPTPEPTPQPEESAEPTPQPEESAEPTSQPVPSPTALVEPTPTPAPVMTSVPRENVTATPTATVPPVLPSPTALPAPTVTAVPVLTPLPSPVPGNTPEPQVTEVPTLVPVDPDATPIAEITTVPWGSGNPTPTPAAVMTSVPRENVTATPTPAGKP